MKSLTNNVVHEVEPLSELEYQSAPATSAALPGRPEANTLELLETIYAKRQLLLKVASWALVFSSVLVFLIPKRYESTVSIMPPESASEAGSMISALLGKAVGGGGAGGAGGAGLATMASNFLGLKSSGGLFIDILRSRTVQEHIVERLNLQQVYWERYKEEARKDLNKKTEITEDRKSGVIHLTITDRSPTRAREIGLAYVEELDRLVAKVSTSSARRQRTFIESRLASVKQDLEDAEQQFSAFASKNATLDVKEQAKAEVESAAILQGQLIASQSELQSLEQIYTDNNVRVRALKARVDELKRQLEKLGGTDASLSAGAPSSGELYPSIRKLPLLGVQWADLYRRVKTQETVYELLTEQYELARIQEAKEIPTVNVIDPANLPEQKSFPPRFLLIALFTVLSLAGCVFWIIEEVRFKNLDPESPKRILAANLIAEIRSSRERLAKYPIVGWVAEYNGKFRRRQK